MLSSSSSTSNSSGAVGSRASFPVSHYVITLSRVESNQSAFFFLDTPASIDIYYSTVMSFSRCVTCRTTTTNTVQLIFYFRPFHSSSRLTYDFFYALHIRVTSLVLHKLTYCLLLCTA